MSRGGRRRRGKRGRRGPGSPEHRPETGREEVEPREGRSTGRRRSHGRAATREVSVLDSMSSLPTSLKTLPPDGTDLDELIGALQSEYGVPTTPQEYRLIIKVPAAEEHTDPQIEVKTETAVIDRPQSDSDEAAEDSPVRLRPTRRRRRGRRRGGGAVLMDGEPVDGEEAEPAGDYGGSDPEDQAP